MPLYVAVEVAAVHGTLYTSVISLNQAKQRVLSLNLKTVSMATMWGQSISVFPTADPVF